MTESAVLALVPEAEGIVGKHRWELDPTTAAGVPAHVTVLYPFLPSPRLDDEVVARLRAAVADVPGFACSFPTTGWFGEEYLWLAPSPTEPFLELTRRVAGAFPECPPYAGRHEPHPHLTVGYTSYAPLAALRAAEAEIVGSLPMTARVGALHLLAGSREADSWRVVAELPLAGA